MHEAYSGLWVARVDHGVRMSRVYVGIISKAPISVRHGIKTPRITESKPPPPPSRFRNSCVPEGKLYPAVPSMEGHVRPRSGGNYILYVCRH